MGDQDGGAYVFYPGSLFQYDEIKNPAEIKDLVVSIFHERLMNSKDVNYRPDDLLSSFGDENYLNFSRRNNVMIQLVKIDVAPVIKSGN